MGLAGGIFVRKTAAFIAINHDSHDHKDSAIYGLLTAPQKEQNN